MEPNDNNDLADAPTTYLNMAAGASVAWHPWNETTFAQAEKQERPVLIDIGTSWSPACQTMAEECYAKEEVAKVVNRRFFAIKVDADEHPDVARRYQAALRAMDAPTNLPMTMFCTPEGEPFYGEGGFFDEAGDQRPPFATMLADIAKTFSRKKKPLKEESEKLIKRLAFVEAFVTEMAPMSAAIIDDVVSSALDSLAPAAGGMPKGLTFANMPLLDFVLDHFARTNDPRAERVFTSALEAMARSALLDPADGAFFHPSEGARWGIHGPVKLAADNAQILKLFTHAYQTTGKDRFADIARRILAWMTNKLADAGNGGFYSYLTGDGTPERVMYTDWTALTVSACLDAARILGDTEARSAALRALDWTLERSWKDGKLGHVVAYADGAEGALPGHLDDHAALSCACLDAYEITGDPRYFTLGSDLAVEMFKQFYHASFKGFMDRKSSCSEYGALDIHCKPFADGRVPAGNPLGAMALLRLNLLNGDGTYRHRAQETLSMAAGALGRFEAEGGTYGLAAVWLIRSSLLVIVLGGGPEADALEKAALHPFAINKVVLRLRSGADLPPYLVSRLEEGGIPVPKPPVALVYRDSAFMPPVTDPAALTAIIKETLTQDLSEG